MTLGLGGTVVELSAVKSEQNLNPQQEEEKERRGVFIKPTQGR